MDKRSDFGDQWRQVFTWFERWQQVPPEERDALLTSLREQHPELYPRLAAMIEADEAAEANSFMADSALDHVLESTTARWAGAALGAWVLRETIGSGGMGQVWLATRGDNLYAGRAAVKMLHVANATPEANARFAREGEFLARMAHPRIAQLYDAGLTPDGTRYLVLEYVEGKPLDEACNARRSTIEARLQLFLQVCEAVAYAHQQHIVHRDLKPSNILVTNDGHVKLLDFGVAKLMKDSEAPELTRAGTNWFTLEYAAPEQIELADITTATDVYSLGVVLYSLLCGVRPNAHVRSLTDAFHYLQSPPRPMRMAVEGIELAAVAAQRSTTPAKLKEHLRGDLETIIAKALKVAPSERYDTAQAFGDDVRRYLNHEPVRARPDSWRYRAGKFIQRNRIQAIAASAVTAAVLLGLIATTWQWRAAAREAQRTRSAISMIAASFTAPKVGEPDAALVSLRKVLNRAWERADKEFANDPDILGELAVPLGLMLSTTEEMSTAAEALEIGKRHLIDNHETISNRYLSVLLQLGVAYSLQGNVQAAKTNFRELLTVAQALNDPTLDEPIYARIQLALLTRREGPLSAAREQLQEAARIAKRAFGEQHDTYQIAMSELNALAMDLCGSEPVPPPSSEDPQLQAIAESFRASYTVKRGDYDTAIAQYRVLLPQLIELFEAVNPYTIYAHTWLSIALFNSGQRQESEREIATAYRLAKDSNTRSISSAIEFTMASQRLRSGHIREAEPLINTNLEYVDAQGPGFRKDQARMRVLRGELLIRTNRLDEAIASLDQALSSQAALAGENNYLRDAVQTAVWRAIAADVQGGPSKALEYYEAAREIGAQCLAQGHPDQLRIHLLTNYAAWRVSDTAATRQQLAGSLQDYAGVLRQRADWSTFPVLERELTRAASSPQVLGNLLSLMNY